MSSTFVNITKIGVVLLSTAMIVSSCASRATDSKTTASVENALNDKSKSKKVALKGNKEAKAKAKADAKTKDAKIKNDKAKKDSAKKNVKQASAQVTTSSRATRTGEVYLLRGLANIFSRGMDTIGTKMVRKGFNARVYNHAAWRDLAVDIIARKKKKKLSEPIIIMGHSLGANAAMMMANYLGQNGVKVSYVVGFDPTIPTVVGKNVSRVVNFYLPNEDNSNKVKRAAGFKGNLKNINMRGVRGNTHLNIEKDHKTHKQVIDRAYSYTKKRRRKTS